MYRSFQLLIALAALSLGFASPIVSLGDDAERPLTEAELFDDQRLLQVQIEMADQDWQTLCGETLSFVEAFGKGAFESDYTWFPATMSINGRVLKDVEVRKKGFFGSMDQVRPSLKVKIKDELLAEVVAGLERLTLNNNKQDRANVSQILAYRLFREAGLPAPRCCLATVTVNGQSLGVYTHVESIEKPFLQRTFDSDKGQLFEGVFPSDFLADRVGRFQFKSGKPKNDRGSLLRISQLLENPPDDLPQQLDELVDLDQFIRYWALESLIGFWDGYAANQNNYYMYRDPRDLKFRFIPWGADMTLSPSFFPGGGGGGGGGGGRGGFGGGGNKSVYAKGLLAYQLNQDPDIRQRYHAELLNLLDTVWREDELIAEVDRIESLVRDHLHPAQGNIEQPAETTRTFIANRRRDIMAEIEDGPVHVKTPPAKPFYMREVGEVAGTFSAQWSPANQREPIVSDEATLELLIDGEPVKFEQVTANSGVSRFPGFGGPRAQGPPPATVVLTGTRDADDQRFTLTITFPADRFRATDGEAIEVQGMLMEGEGRGFGFGGRGMRTFAGEAELTSAAMEEGALVAGSVTGKLYQMSGGFGR